MLESSLIVRTTVSIYQFIVACIVNSYTAKLIIKLFKGIRIGIVNSQFYKVFSLSFKIQKSWEDSIIYKLYKGLIHLPTTILGWIYNRWDKVLNESIIFRLFVKLLNQLHILIGLSLVVLIVAPYSYWNNFYALGMNVVLVLLFIVKSAMNKGVRWNTKGAGASAFIFGVCIILAFVFSIYPSLSLRFMVFYVDAFLLALLLASEINTMKKFNQVIHMIMAAVFMTALYGIYQWIKGIPVNNSYMDVSVASNIVGRVDSTIGNPNNYGELLVLTLPFFASSFFSAKTLRGKGFYLGLSAPIVLVLLLTLSRGSWVGIAMAGFVYVLYLNWRLVPIFMALGLVALPLLPLSISSRVLTIFTGDSSTNMRFTVWKQVTPLIKDFWVTGIGLGADIFIKVMQRYPVVQKAVHAHNIFLQTLIETGIFGLLSFVGMQIHLVADSIRTVKKKNDIVINNHIVAAVSAILGYLVVGLVEYVWHDHRVMLFYFMVVGLLMALLRNAKEC